MPNMANQINMIGPKALPTISVPNCCKKNIPVIIKMTMCTVEISGYKILNPSMAEETEIGGVIIPSANNVQPPITAGIMSHFAFLLTKV